MKYIKKNFFNLFIFYFKWYNFLCIIILQILILFFNLFGTHNIYLLESTDIAIIVARCYI